MTVCWAAEVTIEELGSLGEVIGAVATIATLAYLAVQIRQNGKLVAASIADSHRDAYNELSRVLGSNSQAARVYRAGVEDRSSLSPEETIQFDSLCFLAFNGLSQRYQHGLSIENDAVNLLAQTGLRQFWEHSAMWFPEDFRREILGLMNRIPPAD